MIRILGLCDLVSDLYHSNQLSYVSIVTLVQEWDLGVQTYMIVYVTKHFLGPNDEMCHLPDRLYVSAMMVSIAAVHELSRSPWM